MARAHALIVDRDPAVRSILLDRLKELGEIRVDERETIEELQALAGIDLVIVELDREIADVLARSDRIAESSAAHWIGLSGDPADSLDPRLDHWLAKPLDPRAVQTALTRGVRAARRGAALRERSDGNSRTPTDRFVGCSRASAKIREQIRQAHAHDGPIWIVGAPGSGKRHAARLIHDGERRSGRFVVVDCTNLSAAGWDELWGDRRLGPTVQARSGTLYLEGLTALKPGLQQRLFTSVPFATSGCRLIVGTTEDPFLALDAGRLSPELCEAWASDRVEIPELSGRDEDVPPLARQLLAQLCEFNRLPALGFDATAMDLLRSYSWPGNVAELHEAMAHAALVARETVKPRDLPEGIRLHAERIPSLTLSAAALTGREFREAKNEVVEAFERTYLRRLLEQHCGNVTAAAQQSGMLRSALQRLLRKHGLRSAKFRVRSSRNRGADGSPVR